MIFKASSYGFMVWHKLWFYDDTPHWINTADDCQSLSYCIWAQHSNPAGSTRCSQLDSLETLPLFFHWSKLPSYLSLLDLWYKHWNHLRHCHAEEIFWLAGLGILSWVSTRCIKLAITKLLYHTEKNHKQGTTKTSGYQIWCQNAIWQPFTHRLVNYFRYHSSQQSFILHSASAQAATECVTLKHQQRHLPQERQNHLPVSPVWELLLELIPSLPSTIMKEDLFRC